MYFFSINQLTLLQAGTSVLTCPIPTLFVGITVCTSNFLLKLRIQLKWDLILRNTFSVSQVLVNIYQNEFL